MPQTTKSPRGKKRTSVRDLPAREKRLSKKDAKKIKGGLTKEGFGTLARKKVTVDPSDPSGNTY